VTACLMSAFTASRYPSKCFLTIAKGLKCLGLHNANRTCHWLRRFSWEIIGYSPNRPQLAVCDFLLFGSLKHVADNRFQQPPMWSKLSPPGYTHVTPILSTPDFIAGYHFGTTAEISTKCYFIFDPFVKHLISFDLTSLC